MRIIDLKVCYSHRFNFKIITCFVATKLIDIVLEALAGLEMYKMMKANADPEVQRRILVGKWLYVHNFLGDTFPSEVRYIPGHLRDRNDDEEDDCEK